MRERLLYSIRQEMGNQCRDGRTGVIIMLWEFALVTTRAAAFWIFYRRFREGPTEYYYNSFGIEMMTAMAFTDPTFPP